MNLMNNRKTSMYATLISVLLLLLIFVYYTFPAIQSMRSTGRDIDALLAELEEKRLLQQNLVKYGKQDRFLLSNVRRYVPERLDTERIIRDLKSLEAATGLLFSNYNVAALEESESESDNANLNMKAAVPVQMNFTFRGTRTQLNNLLSEIEDLQRIYHVTNLNTTSDSKIPVALTNDKEIVNCSITMRTYYAPSLQNFFTEPIPIDTF